MSEQGVNVNGDQFFIDWMEDAESQENYQHLLTVCSDFVNELVQFGIEVFRFCLAEAKKDQRRVHLTLLALARHQISYMDAIGVLLSRGCVEGCQPLLRSMLDSLLGITHIV